jgi:hypothetical protein
VSKRKAFLLRLDPLLWEELEHWAQEDLRSVNGQIEFLLRQAVRARGRKVPPEPDPDQESTDKEP